jgi:hypothetical protein
MIRTVYAFALTLFALFSAYYAAMTLAFTFGEGRSEWVFPLLITLIAILTIWTAFVLWRQRDARLFTGISLAVLVALLGWIILPFGNWDGVFIAIVLAWLVSIALLIGVAVPSVRKELQ